MVERTGASMVMVGCLLASAGVGWELGAGWGVVTLGAFLVGFGALGVVASAWAAAAREAGKREVP